MKDVSDASHKKNGKNQDFEDEDIRKIRFWEDSGEWLVIDDDFDGDISPYEKRYKCPDVLTTPMRPDRKDKEMKEENTGMSDINKQENKSREVGDLLASYLDSLELNNVLSEDTVSDEVAPDDAKDPKATELPAEETAAEQEASPSKAGEIRLVKDLEIEHMFDADAIIDAVIAEMEAEADKRLGKKDPEKLRNALWKKWLPRYFGDGIPRAMNPAVDALCRKYGILGYSDTEEPCPLLWFEQFPADIREDYEKKVKRKSSKSGKWAKKHRKLMKKYADIAFPVDNKNTCADYEAAERYRTYHKEHGYDPREAWNMDRAMAFLLYGRFSTFKDVAHKSSAENETEEQFHERVSDKILASLELSIISTDVEFELRLADKVAELNREDTLAVRDRLDKRLGAAYKVISSNIDQLWY